MDTGPLDNVDIPRIEWGEWKLCSTDTTRGYNHAYRGGCSHWLEETGNNTNGCRYRVYRNGATILSVLLKPPCCMVELRCPIGKYEVPMATCRGRLRVAAIEAAHQEWVGFLRTIAGSEVGPAPTEDK